MAAGLVAFALGYRYASVPLYAAALALVGVALFMAYFFRDPHRAAPADETLVVAPADGRVTRVSPLDPADPRSPTVVSIFLSVFDVHVNRAPIAGEVTDVTYTKGRFVIATRDEASLVNEQNSLTIRGPRVTVVCKQIAGVLARRIVCWSKPGDKLALGERFGLIKFSSRTDLILPVEIEVTTQVGDKVRGGVTVLGRLRG